MKKLRLLLLLVLLAYWLLISANCASHAVFVQKPPAAVKQEAPGQKPYTNAVWVGGHWIWKGGKYVWAAGYWAKPQPGKTYVPGHWQKTSRGHVWVKGHWRKR